MAAGGINLTCDEVLLEDYIEAGVRRTVEVDDATEHEHVAREDNDTEEGPRSCTSADHAAAAAIDSEVKKKADALDDSVRSLSRKCRFGSDDDGMGHGNGKRQKLNHEEMSGPGNQVGNGPYLSSVEELEDPLHTILPVEIRWIILKTIHVSELLSLRRVSRAWKTTIDSLIQVDVRIDGASKDFNGRCGLPMRFCQLTSLKNPAHRSLFRSQCPEVLLLVGGICQLNFKEMILNWSYLTKLEICWQTVMKNMLCDKKTENCDFTYRFGKPVFPNLRTLRIEVLTNDNLGSTTKQRIISNLNFLTSFEFPVMSKFVIVFVGYRELHVQDRFLSIILAFIQKHAKQLKKIEVTLSYASNVLYPPAHPRHILFCVPANIKYKMKAPYSATEGHLITTLLRRPDNASPEDCARWEEMLQNTRKLELAIMTRFLNWTIRHLEFFAPTISDYARFLRIIDLMNITMYDSGNHNTATQLDAKIFQNCSQLIHLGLYRAPIIFHEDEVDPAAEIINLHELPQSLQHLHVDGLPAASADILDTIKKHTGLESFRYFQSQVPRRNVLATNGINWDVLEALLQHPNLMFVKVHATALAHPSLHALYQESLKCFANEYGWNTDGITIGYMNMYEVMLTKGLDFLKL